MLSDELTKLFIDGPKPDHKAKGLVRFGGWAVLAVLWRKNRDALMAACGPGRRPWYYWYAERKLKLIPIGERAQLQAIRTMGLFRDEEERLLVKERLAALREEPSARPHTRRVA